MRLTAYLLALSLLIISCGDGNKLKPLTVVLDKTLIESIKVIENRIEIEAKDIVDVKFFYRNRDNLDEYYRGYSTDGKTLTKVFALPTQEIDDLYEIYLTAYGEQSYKDTLIYFYSADVDYEFLRVDFVDVRQGDGAYIRTPEGLSIAIDGGYGARIPSFSKGEYWNGNKEPLMLNYVSNENIDDFEYLIESHNHTDHWGGLEDIINDGYPYQNYLSPDYQLGYSNGDFLSIASQVDFQILNIGYPPTAQNTGANNTSIVLKITYKNTRYLFTGDAEKEVEKHLLATDFDLSADVLKVGHHGSTTSSNSDFLREVFKKFAKVAVMSFGTDNPYGHPHSLVRFSNYDVYGTNIPSGTYSGSNYRFGIGDIRTFTDGFALIVRY